MSDYFQLPITTTNGVWSDIEDIVEERMRDYCVSDGMADYFNGFEEEITLEKIEQKHRAKLKDGLSFTLRKSNAELEQEVSTYPLEETGKEHVLTIGSSIKSLMVR